MPVRASSETASHGAGASAVNAPAFPRAIPIFGVGLEDAADCIGISASKFRKLVDDRRMPKPRKIDGRRVWDVDELRAAFKALPHDDETDGHEPDTWADV